MRMIRRLDMAVVCGVRDNRDYDLSNVPSGLER